MITGQSVLRQCILAVNEELVVPINRHVYVASRPSTNSLNLLVNLKQQDIKVQSLALIDSGAYSCFIHHQFVKDNGLTLRTLRNEVRVYNADATLNRKGSITHYVRMQVTVRNHISWESFLVTDIGKQSLILGLSYLRHHNPEINWKTEQIEFARCPSVCAQHTVSVLSEEVRDLDLPHLEELALDHYTELNDDEWSDQDQFMYWVNNSDDPDAHYIRSQRNNPSEEKRVLTAEEGALDKDSWSYLVPKQYHKFGKVFSKKASERLPLRKPYDHAIELIPEATLPKPVKLYPMNLQERNSLN